MTRQIQLIPHKTTQSDTNPQTTVNDQEITNPMRGQLNR